MADGVGIKVDTSQVQDVVRALSSLRRRQFPYATARALTDVSKDAKKAVQADLPSRFTIRRSLSGAIHNVHAQKKDWPRTRAFVVVKEWAGFLKWHTRYAPNGGWKRSARGGKIAIPTRAAKRLSGGKLRKPDRPREIMAKGGTISTGGEMRRGGRKRRGKGGHLRIIHLLRKRVRIRPRWPVDEVVRVSVRKHYRKRFAHRLRNAVRTARR